MRTVFLDVDTQIDFVFPAGALYVPGAEKVLPNIARLNRFAGSNGILLISTADAHSENDPEFRLWPAHCVAGTVGQHKPAATLFENRSVLPARSEGQIIVEKQHNDVFTNRDFAPLLDELNAERYVVYGVVTEICVKCAVSGLLKRGGARVELVTDAVRSLDEAAACAMFDEFTAAGGVLTDTASVCG